MTVNSVHIYEYVIDGIYTVRNIYNTCTWYIIYRALHIQIYITNMDHIHTIHILYVTYCRQALCNNCI